ncbi:MAG: DUF503 domain-containing protein [Desulfuromonas sp.]|uniref:DUF503 domain-containing protein n=1 Tax=Desulfuromonas sp. TaxID=892 RepID=UPI000CB5FEAA|nr:DUF503 domain-containing protein [Desulfuromonas sp.]PLX84746.1 MAG: DUF503 domain-containing protein [Desulfuromonas sp.]
MVVGVLRLELFLHTPQSLKEKRSLVKRLLGRCRERFPVSCAETGMQDLWQRAELGFAFVSHDEASVHALYERLEEEVARIGAGDVCDRYLELIRF